MIEEYETCGWATVIEEYENGENDYTGKVTTNVVPLPSTLSTVIVPLWPFVTMSKAIDKPSPVPSPVGLVVKKG